MQTTNQEAMQRLADVQTKRRMHTDTLGAFYSGMLIGMAEAYSSAGVISYEQYMQATDPQAERIAA